MWKVEMLWRCRRRKSFHKHVSNDEDINFVQQIVSLKFAWKIVQVQMLAFAVTEVCCEV